MFIRHRLSLGLSTKLRTCPKACIATMAADTSTSSPRVVITGVRCWAHPFSPSVLQMMCWKAKIKWLLHPLRYGWEYLPPALSVLFFRR